MTRHTVSFRQRMLAGTSVLALGLMGALGAAGAAHASPGDIDTNETGSISIIKRASSAANDPGSLDGQQPGSGTPLAGAQFVIHKIDGTDLATTAGWDKVSALKNVNLNAACTDPDSPSLSGYTFSDPKTTSVTNGEGKTDPVQNLGLSAYLVCEKVLPTGALKAAAPFIVTVPTPFVDASGAHSWLYDVTVYPKNVITSAPHKTQMIADDATVGIGDKVAFDITSVVPGLDAKEYFKYFMIVDPMVAELNNIKVSDVTLADANDQNPVTITKDTHYTVDVDPIKHWAKVTFTKDGLSLLKANGGKTVKVSMSATVGALPNDGVIKNTGYLFFDTVVPPNNEPPEPTNPPIEPPNTPGEPPNTPPGTPDVPSTPTDEDVYSKWGSYMITKVYREEPTHGLKGAEFEVYVSDNEFDPACETNAAAKTTKGNALSFASGGGTVTKLVTDNNGQLHIPGVLIDKVSVPKGQTPGLKEFRCFVLVETKAPAGYVLPTGDDAKTVIKVTGGHTDSQNTIKNTKQGVPELPITGASGQVLLTVGGVAMLLFATGGYLVNRRRAAQK